MIDSRGIYGHGATVGITLPGFGKAGHGNEIPVHAGHVHDHGCLGTVGKSARVGVAESSGDPICISAMAHIVDEAAAGIHVGGHSGCGGAWIINLVYRSISIAQEIGTDSIHMHNVRFSIVSLTTTTFRGGDSQSSG